MGHFFRQTMHRVRHCGEYGETGLFAGVPCILGASGVEQVIELPLSEEERAQFHSCCEGIRRNMQHLKEL